MTFGRVVVEAVFVVQGVTGSPIGVELGMFGQALCTGFHQETTKRVRVVLNIIEVPEGNIVRIKRKFASGLRDVCEIDYVKLIDLLPNSYCITIYHR